MGLEPIMEVNVKRILFYSIILTAVVLNSGVVFAATAEDIEKCKTIKWKKNYMFSVRAALYAGTHIMMPENVMVGQDPICTNALWEVSAAFNHVVVQPTSNEIEGSKATLTVIDENNVSYHFNLTRVDSDPDSCVIVEKPQKYLNQRAMSRYQKPSEMENLQLARKIGDLKSQLAECESSVKEDTEDALKKYRTYMYTRYKWSRGMGFMGKELVSDVYDDGRFTYVRVVPNNRGELAFTAKIDGKKEMIEYKVDSENLYRINGIYERFILKYGKSKVTIKRKDNLSNGVF